MFCVDTQGRAFGSTKIRLARTAKPGQPLNVRFRKASQIIDEPKATPFEAFFFALGVIEANRAANVLLTPRW